MIRNLKLYVLFLKLLPRKELIQMGYTIPLIGLAGLMEVASLAALIPLLSIVVDANSAGDWSAHIGLDELSYQHAVIISSLAVISLFIIKNLAGALIYKKLFRQVCSAKKIYQEILFKNYIETPYKYHLKSNSSTYVRNITLECNAIEARFIMPLMVLVAEIIPLSIMLLFLLFLNPMGLVCSLVILVGVSFLITKINSPKLKQLSREQINYDGGLIKVAQESFSSIREITIYKSEDKVASIFSDYAKSSSEAIAQALFLNATPRYILEVFAIICIFLIAMVSVYRGGDLQNVLIELGVFLAAVVKLLPSANKVVAHIQALHYAKPSIINYLDSIGDKSEHNSIGNIKSNFTKFETLEFKNVAYRYEGREPIFDSVNFTIKSGDIIGIIGETGAGKSTLLNIILGLVDPSEGEVLVNGHKMSDIRQKYLDAVGYVPQETFMMDESIRDNVIFHRDHLGDSDIIPVIKLVCMDDVVGKMPNGELSLVGEFGCNISGGQRQRIGIARALLGTPQILILDEATSALDKHTEVAVINNILRDSKDRTIFMIAHRESTLEKCTHIINVAQGKIKMNKTQ